MTTPTTEPGEGAEPEEQHSKAGRDAARYRVRAREAEGRAEALEATVTAYHRREVERLVAERVQDVEDYWKVGGLDVGDLLGEDGTVDAEAVERSVSELLERKPHLEREEPMTFDGGARTTVRRSGASWSGVLTSATQR
jgi:hypothetical protein